VLSSSQIGGDSYTTNWTGSPNSTFSVPGNIVALDVLNAAITLPYESSIRPFHFQLPWFLFRSNATSSAPLVVRKPNHTGAIVGGVVGGLAGIFLLCATAYLWRRHAAKTRQIEAQKAEQSVEPFVTHEVSDKPYVTPPTPASLQGKLGRYTADVPADAPVGVLEWRSQSQPELSSTTPSVASPRENEPIELRQHHIEDIAVMVHGMMLGTRAGGNSDAGNSEPPPEYPYPDE
jgi:hypothetical protein